MDNIFDEAKKYNLGLSEKEHLEYNIYRFEPGEEKVMFLMQNPGGDELPKNELREHKRIDKIAEKERWSEIKTLQEHVRLNNQFLLEWLRGKNDEKPKKFGDGFQKVFRGYFEEALKKESASSDDYEVFWRNFYVTDFIKRRSSTRNLQDADFENSAPLLSWEIKELKKS